jgi:L-alanine-DL-glutamate epimerase-like enolase superfamily enzyme
MQFPSRRALFVNAGALFGIATPRSSDVRVKNIEYSLKDYRYRTPYKFGGVAVDRVTLLNVLCTVESRGGKAFRGFGSMPLGNVWSFPSRTLPYDATLNAMKSLAARMAEIARGYREYGHPVDLGVALEALYLKAAAADAIPKLCTLVTASPFDAAIHDAFGKLHGVNCYHTYGPEFMSHDAGHYLGAEYKGEYLDRYILRDPVPTIALYHSVGASDPIAASDLRQRINDGLPETLPEWIDYNGLTHFKIKLNGDDLKWDVERLLSIDRVVTETENRRRVAAWKYSLDFNERCPNAAYVLDFCKQIREKTPAGFERIQYIEQPTKRDLKADRGNVMHEVAKLRPVIIDESLTDVETLLLARDMGYTGAALKACKGQSQVLLMAAAAQKHKMFLCVQDLTCPGASFIHSAGLAAHVPGVVAIEGNSREYVPAANRPWETDFPGLFKIKDGNLRTAGLTGPGLSAGPRLRDF